MIRFYDDGKQKYQSVEGLLQVQVGKTMWAADLTLTGWGSKHAEAKDAVKAAIRGTIKELERELKELDTLPPAIVVTGQNGETG